MNQFRILGTGVGPRNIFSVFQNQSGKAVLQIESALDTYAVTATIPQLQALADYILQTLVPNMEFSKSSWRVQRSGTVYSIIVDGVQAFSGNYHECKAYLEERIHQTQTDDTINVDEQFTLVAKLSKLLVDLDQLPPTENSQVWKFIPDYRKGQDAIMMGSMLWTLTDDVDHLLQSAREIQDALVGTPLESEIVQVINDIDAYYPLQNG